MSLYQTIGADIVTAMKNKDKEVLEPLRAAKTAFTLAISDKGAGSVLTEEEELKIIRKLVKQRKESAAIYREQNRVDLCEKEEFEASVLEKYLPAKMSTEDIAAIVKDVIAKVGATSSADFGKVMGTATKQLAGKADGREISAIVKQLLS
jgi:uncharacterized protein YqeY